MEVSSVTVPSLDQSVAKGEEYHILPRVNPNCHSFLLFLSLAHMLSSWIEFNFQCGFHCSHSKLSNILLSYCVGKTETMSCGQNWTAVQCGQVWRVQLSVLLRAFLHTAACWAYRPTLLTAEFRGPPLFPRSELQNFTWGIHCPFDSADLALLSGWGDLAELPLLRKNLDVSCSCSASFQFWIL